MRDTGRVRMPTSGAPTSLPLPAGAGPCGCTTIMVEVVTGRVRMPGLGCGMGCGGVTVDVAVTITGGGVISTVVVLYTTDWLLVLLLQGVLIGLGVVLVQLVVVGGGGVLLQFALAVALLRGSLITGTGAAVGAARTVSFNALWIGFSAIALVLPATVGGVYTTIVVLVTDDTAAGLGAAGALPFTIVTLPPTMDTVPLKGEKIKLMASCRLTTSGAPFTTAMPDRAIASTAMLGTHGIRNSIMILFLNF